jgi:uncharacterized RmlC-like cupin family protein
MGLDISNPIIARSGSAAVIYDLSQPYETTITLPAGSSWSSGLHWHETHDENLRVVQGSIRVRLGNETTVLHAGQEANVPKYVRHEWSRANVSGDEDVIVLESTEPRDEEKHLFFWNLNGVILSGKGGVVNDLLLTLRLFMIFHTLDNWPVLLDLSSTRNFFGSFATTYLESTVTHVVLSFAAFISKMAGYRSIEDHFTPEPLLQGWNERQEAKKKLK